MGSLSYTATVSIDGYAADARGDFQWTAPGDEVFRFHVERMAAVSTEVLGRRTFELMRYWETEPEDGSWGPDEHEFARRWRDLDLVVASATLAPEDIARPRARLVRHLSLVDLERIAREAPGEVEVFGPTTAAEAIRADIVSDYRLFTVPMIVGGGLRAIPDDARLELRLVEQRILDGGTVYAHYTSKGAARRTGE